MNGTLTNTSRFPNWAHTVLKKEKICTTKDRIKDKHKNDIFQKHEKQNQKLSTTVNRQHTHNALTTQKIVAVYFKDVKTEETFSSQYQKLVETTNL